MPRTLVCGAVLLLAGPVPGADSGTALPVWPAGLYNPRPLADDVILPLPCGGALAFRPVTTPTDNRRTTLVGAFTGSTEMAERQLLIGKYEVTTLQYQAVLAEELGQPCPKLPDPAATSPIESGVTAQVGVSRIDAVNFSARLSRWLHANADRIPPCEAEPRPCLPRVEGKPAFVRLPLDLEWEYAARGGALVTDQVFALSRYPMPEGLDRHAWYQRNADGEIAPIGRRLPNPLGLHDLYGNAWEVMNDPYRSDQFPGQIGGDVLMGGGVHSTDDELRVDARVEVQPYDAAGDVKTADTGFRVVLAAPVVTSAARLPARPAVPSVGGLAPVLPAPSSAPESAPRPASGPPSESAPIRDAPIRDGQILIEVDVSAIILVDGEVKGAAVAGQPLKLPGLPRGSRRLEARASGDRNAIRTVELTGAEPVSIRIQLGLTPEQAETLLGLKPEERRQIRGQLAQLGYPSGPGRDRFDQGFRLALSQFQGQARLPATGYLNAETRALIERRTAGLKRSGQAPAQSPSRADTSTTLPGGGYLHFPEPAGAERWMDPDVP